jgi:MFS transporter, PHS family, inorganic phosphate transporter
MSSVVSACVSHLVGIVHHGTCLTRSVDGIELMIIIVATFGQAVAGEAHAVNVIGVIIVWRGLMGIGIGGDYPLSAVISSEFASTHIRGRLMTAVFANQGWGQFSEC